MKKLWICSVVCGGLLAGIGLSHARVIPGVDVPYDPGNYYSTVGVSMPDSAPSIFTLRDMGVSVNTTVFLQDYWTDFITNGFRNDPRWFENFIIRDNYGYYDDSYHSNDTIKVDGVTLDRGAIIYSLVGGDSEEGYTTSDEIWFVLRNANWKPTNGYAFQNSKYALVDFIMSQYELNPEKFEKYIAQVIPGNVYDPERHQQNILSCLKYDEILKQIRQITQKKMEDDMPFGNDGIRAGLQYAQQQTQSLNLSKSAAERAEQAFPNEKLTDEEFAKRSPSEQIKFLNEVYRELAASSQRSLENSVARQQLWEEALQRSISAQGSMQAEQAKADMNALLLEEFAERNMLLDNLATMQSVRERYKVSKEIVNARNVMDAKAQSGYSDPYHLDAYEQKHIEKPEPLGLPDF